MGGHGRASVQAGENREEEDSRRRKDGEDDYPAPGEGPGV